MLDGTNTNTHTLDMLFLLFLSHTCSVPETEIQSLPRNLKYLPLFHIGLFSELLDDVPSFDAQQQAHPFYDCGSDRCANVSLSHLSAARQIGMRSAVVDAGQRDSESFRRVRGLLSCVFETIKSAETLVSLPHLRECVHFIYMPLHISALEIEGCIT